MRLVSNHACGASHARTELDVLICLHGDGNGQLCSARHVILTSFRSDAQMRIRIAVKLEMHMTHNPGEANSMILDPL